MRDIVCLFIEACSECDRFANPNMFVANPCSCGSYYQCSKDQVLGHYNVYEMSCGPCTCWDQDQLTCVQDLLERNPNHDQCTDVTGSPDDIQYNGNNNNNNNNNNSSSSSKDNNNNINDVLPVFMSLKNSVLFTH